MTQVLFSSILFVMSEVAHPLDSRELIGYPRTPLPKLSRAQRSAIKQLLKERARDIDPVTALRMALCCGFPIRQEWVNAHQIDLALETTDIAKNSDRLTVSRRLMDAAQVMAVLTRRSEREPTETFRALVKLTSAKGAAQTAPIKPVMELDTALHTIRLATSLVPALAKTRKPTAQKSASLSLLEIVSSTAQSSHNPEVAIRALEFLRVLERHVSWMEIERSETTHSRDILLQMPAVLLSELLPRGCTVDASWLADRISLSEEAQKLFRDAVAESLSSSAQMPLAARNWALAFLHPEKEQTPSQPSSDAALERLALLLINTWEARNDGSNSSHAFSLSSEVLGNGFGLHLGGKIDSTVLFDPDVHEGAGQFRPGDPVKLVRPWIEAKSKNEVRILIRGRVVAVS
jgi:hypothetical protein